MSLFTRLFGGSTDSKPQTVSPSQQALGQRDRQAQVQRVQASAYFRKVESFNKAYESYLDAYDDRSQDDPDIAPLFKQYLELETTYASAAKSLRGRAHEQSLAAIQLEHSKVVRAMLPYFPSTASSSGVRGLGNASGNCSINALLQTLFAAPPLLQSLMQAPELKELRKAYLIHTGVIRGTINSQALRSELHALNPRIDLHAGRWEDAHEVFSVMSSLVPQEVAMESFPAMREVREYEAEALYSAPFGGNPRERTVLTEDDQYEHPYSVKDLPPQPFLFVDPIVHDRSEEADFQQQFQIAFESDESGNRDEDLPGFLHAGNNTTLHYHKQIRSTRTYETTPDYLLVVATRYRYSALAQSLIRVDTPMQMPRVLQLPPGSTRDGSDGRLLLKSFVVYKPGHYVSYVRKGAQWFYCSDTVTRAVTLREVDKALYQTRGGGSYMHYYEKASDEVLDAEPAMNVNRPEKEDTRVATAETKLAWQLKILLQSKQRISKEDLLQESFELFKQLDKTTRQRAYEFLMGDEIKQTGIQTFLADPKALLPVIDQLGDAGKPMKALLEQDDVSLDDAFAAFMKLKPEERRRCYELLCAPLIRAKGIQTFLADPKALLKPIKVNGSTITIIDYLIDMTKKERASLPLPPLKVTVPSTQLEVADALVAAKDRDTAVHYFKLLEPKYHQIAYEAVARGQGLVGDDLATKGWDALSANFGLLTREIRQTIYLEVRKSLPVMPEADAIRVFVHQALRGEPYDIEAFDKLIDAEHVNDLWPERADLQTGTLLNYIAKHDIKNIEHVRPMIERLAAKGADFNAKEFFFGNTPIIWAIANANYDLANLLIEIGFKHKAKFNLQGNGNNAVHLLLAKGYQTVSSSNQRFGMASGSLLLRHLLALSPDSLNDPNSLGYTPLHIAALRRDIGFCQILLEAGANPFAKGPNGETPLDLLSKTHEEASAILKSITAAFELPTDCFKSDFAPQVVDGIRRIFPPTTQLEVAFRLRDALEHQSLDIDPLFQMLDPKYRKGIRTIEDLEKNIRAIIQRISDEQDSQSRVAQSRTSSQGAKKRQPVSGQSLVDPSLSAMIGRPTRNPSEKR